METLMNTHVMPSQLPRGTTFVSRRRALTRLGFGALVLGMLAGMRSRTTGAQATPTAGAADAVARQAITAVNEALATGEMNAIDAAFAPEVVGHPPHRSLVTGEPFSHDLAGLKAGLADMRQFFPDAVITIDDLITSNDTVAARVTFRGTLDAAALGLRDETATPLELGGLMYGRVEEGRIAEFWAYFDPSAYIDLVGLLPGTAQATPEEASEHGHDGAAATSRVEAGAEEVAVILTEFSITLAPSTLHAGQPYAFAVTNEGAVTHEFVIERPGATHEPLIDGDQTAMVVGIAPGESRTLGWTFANPGMYQLACHQPGHYEAGQVLVIDVAG
jgi:uncharacterized cupredoxin-like copper-binding protein/predicted ester cyclase